MAKTDSVRRLPLATVALCIALASCTPTSAEPQGQQFEPTPIRLTKVEGITIEQPSSWKPEASSWRVELTWDAPATPVDHYVIRRDGITLTDDLTQPSYEDTTITPAERYAYEIIAVDATGDQSKPGRRSVHIGRPPLGAALIDGNFNMRMVASSSTNLDTVRPMKVKFFFEALCDEPGCKVKWHFESTNVVLTSRDGTYSGARHGQINLNDCYHRPASGTYTLHLRVTAAQATRGLWLAKKLEGTVREQGDPVAGCLTGSVTWRVEGNIWF